MAVTPNTAIAQTYSIAGSLSCTVTDNGGAGRTATVLSGTPSTVYVRPKLAASTGAGASESDPYELFKLVGDTLTSGGAGSTWVVSLHTDGRTKVTYTGPVSGSIVFNDVLRLLGFTAGTGTIATGNSVYSTYPAIGLVIGWARESDTGWSVEQDHAGTEDGTGRAYGFTSSRARYKRGFTFRWHPKTWSEQASGDYLTPVWLADSAANSSRIHTPTAPTIAIDGPWTWNDFLATAPAKLLGFTDKLQEVIAATVTVHHLCTLQSQSVGRPDRIAITQSAPTYDLRRDVQIALNRTAIVTQ